jgi:ribosomal RNA assembly protein
MIEIVRIPQERKPVLIGKGGQVKAEIEKNTATNITVKEDVEISGEDSLQLMKAKEIVTAIGRGFSSGIAERLLDEDTYLIVTSLEGESIKKRKRLFGRVIGRGGRTRRKVEKETGASICVRGKTLSIIGTREQVAPAEEAMMELLSGKSHAHAYKRMNIKRARAWQQA